MNSRFGFATLFVAVGILGGLGGYRLARLHPETLDSHSLVSEAGSQVDRSGQPTFTVYLMFSPAQCSSQFLSELQDWNELFARYHGSHVWVEPVAVYTDRGELARFWDAVGFKMAVTVDPGGKLAAEFGIHQLPAKLIVSQYGEVVYREEFPTSFESSRVRRILDELLIRGAR